MKYATDIFEFDDKSLKQFAGDESIERTARIEGDKLIMESEIDRRILRKTDLPSDGPVLKSGHELTDWAFLISRRDLESNFYDGGIYAGENFKHGGTWVRDTSFTSMMGLALFYPEKIHEVFNNLLDDGLGEVQFEQYRGYYEDRYFSMTDQILWLLAVEKLTQVQGDDKLLIHGLPYVAKTIHRMIVERMDNVHFLIAGGSSLFDGHSGFPKGMTGPLMRSCSTNLLYLRALKILEDMDILDEQARSEYKDFRLKLAAALDKELWYEDGGYYAQLQYGKNYREERFETLGNVMAMANPDIPLEKAEAIAHAIKQHPYGVPALTPWYEDRIVYHSEGIWPFMMGLMMWAKHQRNDNIDPQVLSASGADLTYITSQLLRTSMLEGTFMELLHGRTGQGRYSPAQVWSASAMLSVVENGIFGMKFSAESLQFNPQVPSFLTGNEITLENITIRGKAVDLTLTPQLQVKVNGQPLKDNKLIFADFGMSGFTPSAESIEIDSALLKTTEIKEFDFSGGLKAVHNDIEVCTDTAEITVFPGEQQIGSYAVQIKIKNGSSSDLDNVKLSASCTGTKFPDYITIENREIKILAGESTQTELRLGFKDSPVHFGGGVLTISCSAEALDAPTELEIPIKRFLTLDCSWRFKPLFKHKSLAYGKEFKHFDYWDMVRVPMRSEFRHGPYQGVLWYAKKLIIPDDWDGEDLIFYCGAMSDWDVTYFNGSVIGRTGSDKESAHGQERKYIIPAEIIKPGKVNTMAVQVYCHGEENGMFAGPVFISSEANFDWAKAMGQHVLDSNYLPEIEQGSNDAH